MTVKAAQTCILVWD